MYTYVCVPTPALVVQESLSLRVLLWFSWGVCSCVARSFIRSYIYIHIKLTRVLYFALWREQVRLRGSHLSI